MRKVSEREETGVIDTPTIFKTVKAMQEDVKPRILMDKSAGCLNYAPHDANSNADVLKWVTMIALSETEMICYAFGIRWSKQKKGVVPSVATSDNR